MKKLFTFFALSSFTAIFSQINITTNLPASTSTGASFDTEVKISKGTVGNFAKYQMDVPVGYIVSSIDVKGGNFTFENQRAKIVWVSVPSEPEFTVKFKIQVGNNAPGQGTFVQKFYYLENNEKKEVEATPVSVTLDGSSSPVASTTPAETTPVTTTPAENKPVETTPVTTTPTETKPVETTPVTTTPAETKPVETTPVTSTPVETKPVAKTTSEAGMTYRVQLGAFSVQPSKSKFAGVGNVNIDMIDGMYKVTTGNFSTKEEAIKHRDQLQAKGYQGFVVKYKDGKRVN